MVTGYRAIMRLEDREDAVRVAREQLYSWLKSKATGPRKTLDTPDWEGPGAHRLGSNAVLRVYHSDNEADSSCRRLYRFTESNDYGAFTVSMYAANLPKAHKGGQTIVLETAWAGRGIEDKSTTSDGIWQVDPPRLVTSILDTYRVTDGSTRLSGSPILVDEHDEYLAREAILDPNRIAFVTVAAEPDPRFREGWNKIVASLTRQSVGVAAVYVVAANAVEAFNEALPYKYQIATGQVRTFQPKVDFDDTSDSFRHRLLTLPTLERNVETWRGEDPRVKKALAKKHAFMARRRFIEEPLPKDVRSLIHMFDVDEAELARKERSTELRVSMRRQADAGQAPLQATIREARAEREKTPTHFTPRDLRGRLPWQLTKSAPSPKPSTERPSARPEEPTRVAPKATEKAQPTDMATKILAKIKDLMGRWFGETDVSEKSIDELDEILIQQAADFEGAQEEIRQKVDRISSLEQELEELRSSHTDLRANLALAQTEATDHFNKYSAEKRRANKMASALYTQDRADEVVHPLDAGAEWGVPNTLSDLVDKLKSSSGASSSLKYIVFTGDSDETEALDDQAEIYVDIVWSHIHALADYAQSKAEGFSGGFKQYLDSPDVTGSKFPSNHYAAKESDTTSKNPKFRAARTFKVPAEVDSSRRVFMASHTKIATKDTIAPRMHFHDDTANTGKIYIGYIGRHLPNPSTS